MSDCRRGFLIIGFTEHLQNVTTNNCIAIANSHTLHITTARIKSSQSVYTSRCLVTEPNNVLYVLTLLPAADYPTTNTLLKFSCTENTVPMLLFNCCLSDHVKNIIPLLLSECRSLVTVQHAKLEMHWRPHRFKRSHSLLRMPSQ
jgi:hypothetical protein